MDSDEYLTDEGKRKKEDVDELFKRSKRTVRTPTKGEGSKASMENQMKTMISLMEGLVWDTKDIKTKQQNNNEETKKLQVEIRRLRKVQREFKGEIKERKGTNEKAMREIEKIERMEGDKRKKNIILQGLRVSTTNTKVLKEEIEGFMTNALGVTLKVEMVKKLKEDMCLVELNSKNDKRRVMQCKSNLRNLIVSHKVYLSDDLTQNKRKIQNIIRKQAKDETAKGKIVKVGYKKLTCDQELWTWSNTSGKLEK